MTPEAQAPVNARRGERRPADRSRRAPCDAGRWELYDAGPGEPVELASVRCSLAVDEVYRDPLSQDGTAR
jgi:hypothetical protein